MSWAIAAGVLAGAVTVLEVVEAATAWPLVDQYQAAVAEGANQMDSLYGFVSLPLLAVLIASWVVTSLWLSRARRNADAMAGRWKPTRPLIWSWLGWIVPVVNLWLPYQLVRELPGAIARERSRPGLLVGWWWAMLLLYGVSGRIAARIASADDPDVDTLRNLTQAEAVNAIFALVALGLWVQLLRRVTRAQVNAG